MSEDNNNNSTNKTTYSKEESIIPNVFEKIISTVEKDNDSIVDTTLKTDVNDHEKNNDTHSDSNEIVDEKLKKDLQSQLQISSCSNLPMPSVSVTENDDKEDDDEEELDEDEFKCEECDTIQGLNNCELCDAENVCEECYGQGGDYGPNEIWVCNECLPTCNECKKKLYTAFDECCGKGRSDLSEESDDE